MTTTYSKIKGRPKGYRYRNTIVDLQRELYKRNAKKTPKELDMHEKFEDVPTKLSDRDKIGRVKKVSTSTIQHMRGGGTFDD